MANRKPPNAGNGRPKGAANKTTTALKEAILLAAEEHGEDGGGTGGLQGYLLKVAREDVKAFSGLLGRVLPLTVAGDPDNPLRVQAEAMREFTSKLARVAARQGAGETPE